MTQPPLPPPTPPPTPPLCGRRLLVVEDEYLIAVEIRRALEGAGATVVGPVGNLAAALALAEQPLDGAVLDVNLAGEMSYPLADRLRARGVPGLFLTGYDGWSLPAAYRQAPRLTKPFAPATLVSAVAGLVAGDG